ncbi:MAG TPA: hypothetical protein VF079_03670 [Sphingomicrobium sp.]|jgi:hypothetical protein
METEALIRTGQAAITFNKVTGRIQFTVPQGTTFTEAIKSLAKVDLSVIDRLPHGCSPCLSGYPFDIRDQFDPVINVKLGQPG